MTNMMQEYREAMASDCGGF